MMIRRAAFAVLMLAPSALAAQTPQTGQGRLEVVGEAPNACVIRGPATAVATNATYTSIGTAGGRLEFGQLVTSPQSLSRGATLDLALNVVCNSPHWVAFQSRNGGLLRDGSRAGATSGPFAEFLPYEVRASWLGWTASSASDAPGQMAMQSNQGGTGQLSLGLVVPAGVRLAAGNYGDTVSVVFRAAE